MTMAFYAIGVYEQATAFSQRALDLALTGPDTGFQATAYSFLGVVAYAQGAYGASRDYCRQARALLHGDLLYERFGQPIHIAVHIRYRLALCLAELGAFAEGVTMGSEGLHIAEAVKHPASLTLALYSAGATYLRQGELRQALPLLERGMQLCQETNLKRYFSHIAPALGSAYILDGRAADALPLLEEAVAQAVSNGRKDLQAFRVATLSEAHLHAGHLEVSRTLAEQALEHARTYHERGNEAYALRLIGDIAIQRDPPSLTKPKPTTNKPSPWPGTRHASPPGPLPPWPWHPV